MIGSVLVNYSELTTTPANPRWEVRVNGILVVNERDLQYTKASRLYSTRVSPGDTLTVGIFGIPAPQIGSIGVYRKDYTTDDEGGDNGIKITSITGRTGNNGSDSEGGFCVLYNIPITTRPDAYGFEYITDLTLGTGLIDILKCSGGSAVSGATIQLLSSSTIPNNGDFVKLFQSGSNYFNGINCYEVTNNNSLGPISTPTYEFTGVTVNSSFDTCIDCTGYFLAATGTTLSDSCSGTTYVQIYYTGTLPTVPGAPLLDCQLWLDAEHTIPAPENLWYYDSSQDLSYLTTTFSFIKDVDTCSGYFLSGTGTTANGACDATPSVPIYYGSQTLPTVLFGGSTYLYLNPELTIPAPGGVEPAELWYSDGTYSYLVTTAGTGQIRDVVSCACLSYTVYNPSGITRTLIYTNCSNTLTTTTVTSLQTITVCAKGFGLSTGLIINEGGGSCP